MDRDEMLRRIEQHYDSFWRGRTDDLEHQLAPDFVDDEAPGSPPGPEPVKQASLAASTAFPDMVVRVDDAVVEGPVAAVHATWHGTHTGAFLGQPATGRSVTFQAIVIWRFDDQGRIVRRTAHVDRGAIAEQLAA